MRAESAREEGAGTRAVARAPSTELPEGRLIEALHQEVGEGAALLYLHGSTARGETHRDSDLDLAVLLDWNAFRTKTLLMAIDLEIFLAKFRSMKLQKAQEP